MSGKASAVPFPGKHTGGDLVAGPLDAGRLAVEGIILRSGTKRAGTGLTIRVAAFFGRLRILDHRSPRCTCSEWTTAEYAAILADRT